MVNQLYRISIKALLGVRQTTASHISFAGVWFTSLETLDKTEVAELLEKKKRCILACIGKDLTMAL